MAPYRLNALFIHDYDGREAVQQESRTLMELNALRGVGAILDKKQWWLKWTDRPEVRSKWLREIKHAFVAKSVVDILSCWPVNGEKSVLCDQVKAAMQVSEATERRQLLEAACREVRYIDDWADDEADREERHYGSNDGMYSTAIEDLAIAGTDNLPPLRWLNPYGQVAWYMHEWVHIQRIRELAVETLTLEQVDAVFDDVESVAQRTADLVLALCDGNLTLPHLREALGSSSQEHSDVVLLSLIQYIAMIHSEINNVGEFVAETINTVLDHRSGKSFAAVQETFQSDELVPEELKAQLLRGVARLEDIPADQQDWHPHANNQVLDLVHPSLYCGI